MLIGEKSKHKSKAVIATATVTLLEMRDGNAEPYIWIVLHTNACDACYSMTPEPKNFSLLFDMFNVRHLKALEGQEVTAYLSHPSGAAQLLGFQPAK